MREPSTEQLEQDSRLLELARDDCEHLISMVDDERLDLEVSDYFQKAALATLERLSDVFSHRETRINEQLETRSNQALDRFVQKQRKR